MTNPLACATCPARDRAACAALSDEQRDELGRLGQRRTLQRGETLLASGDERPLSATLISGALKISNFDADGTERILSLVHPAGFIGEMFAPIAHHDVVALTTSQLCVFTQADYAAAVDRFPALAKALLRRTADDLLASRATIDLISRHNAQQRVASFLLGMARAASDSPCHPASEFELPLTRGEIAGFLGLTIETVSRQLTALESEGAIRRAGQRSIHVSELGRLEAAAA